MLESGRPYLGTKQHALLDAEVARRLRLGCALRPRLA